ncbi:MAG: 1,4-alpha-glucan-branching enzyme, partial [Clostridia bacterium]|nr:1,4-alpha-glucan-branching enzyme [Clostridia bacterium]
MYRILEKHPELQPFEGDINLRMDWYHGKRRQLIGEEGKLTDFANAHHYYGFHYQPDGWVYREWAPAADQLYLAGDFNDWHWTDTPLKKLENGNWELFLPGDTLKKGSKVITIVRNGNNLSQHLPLYTKRAVQDWQNGSWCCEVWDNLEPYPWTDAGFASKEPAL